METQPPLGKILPTLDMMVDEAVVFLQKHEPDEGYYLAFSGGKDSCVIKALAVMAGVKFDAWYSQTTIDPPELVYFLREHHPDVKWIKPNVPFFKKVETEGLPTRRARWCCKLYKEQGGNNRVKILGIRAFESNARRLRWSPVIQNINGGTIINPILFWRDHHVWDFIRSQNLPYCRLYDEGFDRIGCIGCPMTGKHRLEHFDKWPGFGKAWKRSARIYWESKHGTITRKGKPHFCSKFRTPEQFFEWWLSDMPSPSEFECTNGLF